MCANGTTGDPVMDGILEKQGVTMGMGWPPPAGAAVVDGNGDLLGTKDPRRVMPEERADRVVDKAREKEAVGKHLRDCEGMGEGGGAQRGQTGAGWEKRKVVEGPAVPPSLSIDDNLSKEETQERMYELRRRLANGEGVSDYGGQVLSEEQVSASPECPA